MSSKPPYIVQLLYFKPTGRFMSVANYQSRRETISAIWAEVEDMRRLGRLPGLPPGVRTVIVLVDAIDHVDHQPYLVMPPPFDDEDVTPVRDPAFVVTKADPNKAP